MSFEFLGCLFLVCVGGVKFKDIILHRIVHELLVDDFKRYAIIVKKAAPQTQIRQLQIRSYRSRPDSLSTNRHFVHTRTVAVRTAEIASS